MSQTTDRLELFGGKKMMKCKITFLARAWD